MEVEKRGQRLLKHYREKAIWGGAFLGLIIGASQVVPM